MKDKRVVVPAAVVGVVATVLLVNVFTGWRTHATPNTPTAAAPAAPVALAPADGIWVKPVAAAICWGYSSTHLGVDLCVAEGTEIHAAAAGVVDRVVCQASLNGAAYSCDQDGSAAVTGCGWYVRIRHADDVWTLYCHQRQHPLVEVGQHVDAGQVIGLSGSSGHSTGPHVHFEVDLIDGASDNSTDPGVWMTDHGAPLGP